MNSAYNRITGNQYEPWGPDTSFAESNPTLRLPVGLEVLEFNQHIPGHSIENFRINGPEPQQKPTTEFENARKQAARLVQRDRLTPRSRESQIEGAEVRCSLDTVRCLPHTDPAWIGYNVKEIPDSYDQQAPLGRNPNLGTECSEELKTFVEKEGGTYIENILSRAQVVRSKEGQVYVVKCKILGDDWEAVVGGKHFSWIAVVDNVESAMEEFEKGYGKANKAVMNHTRGAFPCFSFGTSVGGGQTHPSTKTFNEKVEDCIIQFCKDPFVTAYVDHIADCFRIWFPKLAQLYSLSQLQLLMVDGLLSQHFPDLQFAAYSLNYGTNTVCDWHKDLKNLVFGVCAVGIFGRFNYRTSAQLMLKEAKVALELCHGDVVFFPSAGISHKNAALKEGETRRSFVFYSTGGLFRWIEQGHHKQVEKYGDGDQRWKEGCDLFSTMEELRESFL